MAVPPPAADGLSLIKTSVRSQRGYTLVSPVANRKLNQNESPYDLPSEIKQEVLDAVAGQSWQRYPEFVPRDLLAQLAEYYGWLPDGILVGNGSNELIQSTLAVTL